MNEPNVPTREDNHRHSSTIDLVFANEATTSTNILSKVYVNTEIGSLSDHHAFTFTIGPPLDESPCPKDNRLNWKHGDEEKFHKVLKVIIERNRAEHPEMLRDL